MSKVPLHYRRVGRWPAGGAPREHTTLGLLKLTPECQLAKVATILGGVSTPRQAVHRRRREGEGGERSGGGGGGDDSDGGAGDRPQRPQGHARIRGQSPTISDAQLGGCGAGGITISPCDLRGGYPQHTPHRHAHLQAKSARSR